MRFVVRRRSWVRKRRLARRSIHRLARRTLEAGRRRGWVVGLVALRWRKRSSSPLLRPLCRCRPATSATLARRTTVVVQRYGSPRAAVGARRRDPAPFRAPAILHRSAPRARHASARAHAIRYGKLGVRVATTASAWPPAIVARPAGPGERGVGGAARRVLPVAAAGAFTHAAGAVAAVSVPAVARAAGYIRRARRRDVNVRQGLASVVVGRAASMIFAASTGFAPRPVATSVPPALRGASPRQGRLRTTASAVATETQRSQSRGVEAAPPPLVWRRAAGRADEPTVLPVTSDRRGAPVVAGRVDGATPSSPAVELRPLPPPPAPAPLVLTGPAVDRLAEDVIARIERRARIERERRGL